jgi:hypothetical protein
MHRSERRSRWSTAGVFSIITNCVVTQQTTLTRSRSMRSSAPAASNRGITTVGQPSSAGVNVAVHCAKPYGAGMSDMNTSSAVNAPASTASRWK